MTEKKRTRVVAAIIIRDGKVFSAKRAYGFLKGQWEFPGGKIEAGESPEQAIIREIKEELDTDIAVDSFFTNVVHDYPDFTLDMDVFFCHVINGRLHLDSGIHTEEAFFDIATLLDNDWCPADLIIARKITERYENL